MIARHAAIVAACCLAVAGAVPAAERGPSGPSHSALYRPSDDASPVKVVGVAGDAEKGWGWPSIRLDDDRAPASVTFGWYLVLGRPGRRIWHGQGAPVAIATMAKGRPVKVDTVVATRPEVNEAIVEAGVAPGDACVAIAVDEIVYADGSKWTRSDSGV
jgi:hypothetical protein